MEKLSLIGILAYFTILGCGTRPQGDSISVDDRGYCKQAFVNDYEKAENLMQTARENSIGEAKTENHEKVQAALEACAQFKTAHRNNICRLQDKNGEEDKLKAKHLNDDCDEFAKVAEASAEAETKTGITQ